MSNDLSNGLTHKPRIRPERRGLTAASSSDLSNSNLDLRTRTERAADSTGPVADCPAAHPRTLGALRRAREVTPIECVLMSQRAVARALSVSEITVYRWTRAGLLRALKLGDGSRRAPLRYRASDIAAFIAERLAVSAGGTE